MITNSKIRVFGTKSYNEKWNMIFPPVLREFFMHAIYCRHHLTLMFARHELNCTHGLTWTNNAVRPNIIETILRSLI